MISFDMFGTVTCFILQDCAGVIMYTAEAATRVSLDAIQILGKSMSIYRILLKVPPSKRSPMGVYLAVGVYLVYNFFSRDDWGFIWSTRYVIS